MPDKFTENQEQKFESYLNIHLKKDQQDLSREQQVKLLHKRQRNKWFHLLLNFVAILLFGYSFYYDLTQLSETIFLVIMGVFAVNIGLIFYQRKQIGELIAYLNHQRHDE